MAARGTPPGCGFSPEGQGLKDQLRVTYAREILDSILITFVSTGALAPNLSRTWKAEVARSGKPLIPQAMWSFSTVPGPKRNPDR